MGRLTCCHANNHLTLRDTRIYSASGVFMLVYALLVNGIKKWRFLRPLVSYTTGGRAFNFTHPRTALATFELACVFVCLCNAP